MALNPFFLQGSQQEQSLVQDLINEQLRMYGVEVFYLPRQYVTEKTIIKEVIESEFKNAFPLEAYVNNYDGYADNSQLLTKFGLQATNEINLIISQERYDTYIQPLIQNLANIRLSTRPKEGDLIYFPLGDRLFEIKFVEHEKPFYMLQKNYTYELRCELFRHEDEIINTGVDAIDDETIISNVKTLTLVGSGSTATLGGLSIMAGGISKINLTNRGEGYNVAPRVAISSAPSGGLTAVGIATLLGDLVNCDGRDVGNKVQGVEIVNPGFGYTVAPGVGFYVSGTNTGVGAAASTVLSDGVIGIVTITSGGSGYTTAPTVTISAPGAGHTQAEAIAVVSSAGTISAIRFTNAGSGYTSGDSPTITITGPYMVGVGTYQRGETVTGSQSGTTAIVQKWTNATGLLDVSNVTGDFTPGESITGAASSAVYQVRVWEEDNERDNFGVNKTIESEADAILDFSETNPFGTP